MTVSGKYVPPFTVASLATTTHSASLDDADAGHDPGSRRLAVVHVPRGQRGQLEERRVGVAEAIDPLAGGELPPGAMPLERFLSASLRDSCSPLAQLDDELLHALPPSGEDVRVAFHGAGEHGHRHAA